MTLQQEVYNRIDKLSDEGIRLLISIIDNIQVLSVSGFKQEERQITEKNTDIIDTIDADTLDSMTKEDKKQLFVQSAGNMKIDSHAIYDLRERSMI